MEFTASQIADFLHGTVEGDPSVSVSNFSKIEEGKPGTLSFLSNPKYSQYIYESKASIILVNKDFVPEKKVSATLIRVDNAYESLAFLLSMVEQSQQRKTGISPLAYIATSAQVADDAYVAPFVFIGENVKIGKATVLHSGCSIEDDVIIGDNTTLYAGVKIYKNCKIANNCILHAGSVVGSDGFGFAPIDDGKYRKIPQMGNVVIEDDVEIGANTTIDRATIGSTTIHKGVKLDNLVQVAHNVEIGENTAIASQTGISGSTKVGKNCVVAGQVGFAGHITVADRTLIGGQAGVTNTIKHPDQTVMGYNMSAITFRKSQVIMRNLPDLRNTVYALQRKIDELEKKLNNTGI